MNRQNPPPTLRDVLDKATRNALSQMNCIQIGKIETFNATNQTATVSIAYQRKIKGAVMAENGLGASDKVVPYPMLVQVPVVCIKGGVARLTMPIAKGDECLLFFSDREIDTWFQYGSVNQPPASDRVHDLSDAIALVGISSTPHLISDYNTLISSLIDLHGERLAQTGDTKTSLIQANHSGWLMMDGKTIGDSGSGAAYTGEQYRALFEVLKEVSPNTGSEDFDDGDTVTIPDMRGRHAVGADNMGGSQAGVLTFPFTPNRNVLGGDIGEETHLLTGRESGIQQHHHANPIGSSEGTGLGIAPNANISYYGNKTQDTGHASALDRHNTVQPGKIMNWFIKI